MKYSGATVVGMTFGFLLAAGNAHGQGLYSQWPTDALDNPNFFPIGVWYQSPNPSFNNEITGYAAMHINTFVYLDPSTTTTVLNDIAAAHMYAIMDYSPSLVNNPTIIAWYNGPDEPDNAQANGSGGYGDPVLPATQISQYQTIKSEDPTRPVYEGFGQGVAWAYPGRGSRTGDSQDYPYQTSFKWTNGQTYTQGYLASTDIGAFDIYPENSTASQVAGKTSIVGTGVQNLVKWSKPGAPVWNTIETTQIDSGEGSAPTPAQVKAEVWISLVNGSTGIIYFAHTISPFSEDALLQSPTMNPAVTAINAQVESLAPELNSATVVSGTLPVAIGSGAGSVDLMTKVYQNNEYLFAATDQSGNGTAVFNDPALAGVSATVVVIGENRQLSMVNGQFTDSFVTNGVHLYEIENVTNFITQGALLTVSGSVTLNAAPSGSPATTTALGALTIPGGATPTGTLNLTNNALIVSNGGAATLAMVQADIAYARNGGLWNQPGITSTNAQAAFAASHFDSRSIGVVLNSSLPTPYTSFGGQPVSTNDVLIKYTYGGDANLDGVVNGNDYFQIDRGFLDHYTGWINGDFNYDGTINGNDYFIIDSNFIDQSGMLAAPEVLAHAAEFGPSYLSQFSSAQMAAIGVPEPASLALLGLGVIGLALRRRREFRLLLRGRSDRNYE